MNKPKINPEGIKCTCPDDATLEEIEAIGGHWPDCPRAIEIKLTIGIER